MSDVTASRKTVTVLFSDLVESTSLAERLDPETLSRVLNTYFDEMRAIVEAHGGSVEKFIGDAVVGVFGVPVVHEDDAIRATRAALLMQEAIARLNLSGAVPPGAELRARIGINTGEVIVSPGSDSLALGHAMSMAARLEQAAGAGEVLIGRDTQRLLDSSFETEPVDPLSVKGSSEPLAAWRVLAIRETGPRDWTGSSAFVGRDREVEQILITVTEAGRDLETTTVTVLAPPGLGKSRLAAEVANRIDATTRVLIGRCVPYGEGITYAPLLDMIQQLDEEHDGDAVERTMSGQDDGDLVTARVRAIASGAAHGSPDDTAWAFRRLLEALSTDKPLVCVLDDLHWADPLLLDLVEYIATFSTGSPLTLLLLARPELFDLRPSLVAPRMHSILIRLEPLSREQTIELLQTADPTLDKDARERIAEAADGVPLFAEQIAAFDADGRAEIPPTVRALLAARVDRLDNVERDLLQTAAIEGELFHRATVAELAPETSREGLGGRLISLVQSEFIRPERGMSGQDAYRFRHALIRDAVYEQMPRLLRSELHERYATLLATSGNGHAPQEVIGHHLETAYRELASLGAEDPRANDLALSAGRALKTAGMQAMARIEWQRASSLLARAANLLVDAPTERLTVLPELITAYTALPDFDAADALHVEGVAEAVRLGDRAAELRIEVAWTHSEMTRGKPGAWQRGADIARQAIEQFSELGDERSLAQAWILLAQALLPTDVDAAIDALKRAQDAAVRGDDEFAQIVVWDEIGGLMLAGRTPFDEIEEFMQRERAWAAARGLAFVAADGLLGKAYCLDASGNSEAAFEVLMQAREVFADLPGRVAQHGETYVFEANMERAAGRPSAAIPLYERAAELADLIGSQSWKHGALNGTAHALIELGRLDEASAVLRDLRDQGLSGSAATQGSEIAAQGRLALARGDLDSATANLEQAAAMTMAAGRTATEARMREYLADVHQARADPQTERKELKRALALYEAKKFVPGVRRVRERLTTLS